MRAQGQSEEESQVLGRTQKRKNEKWKIYTLKITCKLVAEKLPENREN